MENGNEYIYDFFLSYPVQSLAGKWVQNHFLPVLNEELQAAAPHLRLFCWTENQAGVIWDIRLRQAHKRSKLMIAVMTPPYFYESQWCTSEWHTMIEREKLSQLGSAVDWSDSLICPVLFSDGNYLPWGARRITSTDFRKWALPEPVFRETPAFLDFRLAVRAWVNQSLLTRLHLAPAWSANWPEIKPPLDAPPRGGLPRL